MRKEYGVAYMIAADEPQRVPIDFWKDLALELGRFALAPKALRLALNR